MVETKKIEMGRKTRRYGRVVNQVLMVNTIFFYYRGHFWGISLALGACVFSWWMSKIKSWKKIPFCQRSFNHTLATCEFILYVIKDFLAIWLTAVLKTGHFVWILQSFLKVCIDKCYLRCFLRCYNIPDVTTYHIVAGASESCFFKALKKNKQANKQWKTLWEKLLGFLSLCLWKCWCIPVGYCGATIKLLR